MRGAIHDIQILTRSVSLPDAFGRGGAITTATTVVRGRAMLLRNTEQNADGQYAEDEDLVVALPLGAVVSPKDQIVLDGVDPAMDGIFEVMYVNWAQAHLEVGCRRREIN
jgi:hypothetical protein